MKLTRRSFIASLAGALAVPRLALPAPPAGMVVGIAPELIAFQRSYNDVIAVRTEVVLWGMNARNALQRSPHLWSAVMVDKKVV